MQSVPADVDQAARRRKTTPVTPTGNRLPHRADTRQCQYRHSNPADHSIWRSCPSTPRRADASLLSCKIGAAMQVSHEPVYQSKQNRSKNVNTRCPYSAGRAQVDGLFGVRLRRVRAASYRHVSVGSSESSVRTAWRQRPLRKSRNMGRIASSDTDNGGTVAEGGETRRHHVPSRRASPRWRPQ